MRDSPVEPYEEAEIPRVKLMTMRHATHQDPSEVLAPSDLVEEKLLAFAEQLGWFVGTVHAKAPGWLDRTVLIKEIGRVQDSAADLLAHVNALQRNTTAKRTAISATRRSRGPVDAAGKRHRKPLPAERIDRQMGEPRGKQVGQKSAKTGRRGGRS
jgi:hypothetical protein